MPSQSRSIRKEELSSLEFNLLQLIHYVSITERQIIKLSSKHVSNYNLSIMIKAESNYIKGYYFT